MSRAAVYEMLTSDSVLGDEPFSIGDKVFPSYTLRGSRQAPADGFFLILRWEERLDVVGHIEVLTVWSHRPRSAGIDYEPHLKILERVKDIMLSAVHVEGSDGRIMTQAAFKGLGPDNMDEGYDTTTKYAVFEVNSKVGI